MLESLREALVVAESWSAEDVLHWAFGRFGNKAAIASAFGAEGMVLIDIASRVLPDFRVFTLDTEFLFPETYDLMESVQHLHRRNRNVCAGWRSGAATRISAVPSGRSSR
jgi:3'-phosphoadenosine 5'-phosphosulfate sulfotransferase (PAPS reductase)/FAD synthetase